MKEHGLVFCPEMIRALLDGRKTRTSRIVKPQPEHCNLIHDSLVQSKYSVGDLIYAKETFMVQPELWTANHEPQPIHYAADTPKDQAEDYVTRSCLFMPKWASRIWRKITGIKVLQIQDTTEEEAEAEGVEPENAEVNCSGGAYLNGFVGLWDELHPDSWDRNDWIIALTFQECQR